MRHQAATATTQPPAATTTAGHRTRSSSASAPVVAATTLPHSGPATCRSIRRRQASTTAARGGPSRRRMGKEGPGHRRCRTRRRRPSFHCLRPRRHHQACTAAPQRFRHRHRAAWLRTTHTSNIRTRTINNHHTLACLACRRHPRPCRRTTMRDLLRRRGATASWRRRVAHTTRTVPCRSPRPTDSMTRDVCRLPVRYRQTSTFELSV